MKLQYMLSNGRYIDVSEGKESGFLRAAIEFDQAYPDTYQGKLGLNSNDDVIELLIQGKELRHGSDWYEKIRDGAAHERNMAALTKKRNENPNYSDSGWELDCGCTVYYKSHIMNANMGTSCTDCYDRLS